MSQEKAHLFLMNLFNLTKIIEILKDWIIKVRLFEINSKIKKINFEEKTEIRK